MTAGYLAHSFDLLNVGDLDVISQVRALCSRLIVGVLSDESVEQFTGRPPVVPLAERLALVSHVRGVDEVVVHEATKLEELQPAQVFAVSDTSQAFGAGSAVVLTPVRQTASATLVRALRPTGDLVAA